MTLLLKTLLKTSLLITLMNAALQICFLFIVISNVIYK
jgi:hypothetical protein